MKYLYLDSGQGQRLEAFGPVKISRPCAHAIWPWGLPSAEWGSAQALFSREKEEKWSLLSKIPNQWEVELGGVCLYASLTSFGHVGIFPEHAFFIEKLPLFSLTGKKVLHLFAHTGLLTLALAQRGACVCHVDASKPAMQWAKNNAELNQLSQGSIRWILEDVQRFVKREVKRNSLYDAILLDPPSFGRGPKQEVFKIEKDLMPLLLDLAKLLVEKPLFVLLTCHSSHFTPCVLKEIMRYAFPLFPQIEAEEMVLTHPKGSSLPLGSCALGHNR